MLNISFEPALKVETRVRPAIQGDAIIKIVFHASLDPPEWHRIEQKGSSLEVWSDITADGRNSGEWRATKLVKSGSESDTVPLEASLVTLSPRGAKNPSRFSYTYRVRHSSGEIQWLGSPNSDGHIVLDSEPFWSPSGDSSSTAIGTLNWATRWRGWLLSTEQAPATLTLLSLNGRETSPTAPTLLLVPSNSRKGVSQPPSLILHSSGAPINVCHGKVYCETPKDVTVEIISEGGSIPEFLKTHGILSIPTSERDTFFVLSSRQAASQISFLAHPISLSPCTPTTVTVSSFDMQSITVSAAATIIYPPGQGFSQPILIGRGEHEIPLSNGSEPLRVVLLQSIPNSEGQLVGVATPSTVHQARSPASLGSPTLTAVDPTGTTAAPKAAVITNRDGGAKNLATVTVSKSSKVLFAHTVTVPDIVTLQIGRLLRFKLLYAFYRLALYVLALVIPFLGINLSLKIYPPQEAKKPGGASTPEQSGKEVTESSALKTREEPTSESSLYFDVEPVSREVHVTFLGDAVDQVSFTVDGNKIDPWSIVQTWHGDHLHQFLLKMDAPSRLGISIEPTTSE